MRADDCVLCNFCTCFASADAWDEMPLELGIKWASHRAHQKRHVVRFLSRADILVLALSVPQRRLACGLLLLS